MVKRSWGTVVLGLLLSLINLEDLKLTLLMFMITLFGPWGVSADLARLLDWGNPGLLR